MVFIAETVATVTSLSSRLAQFFSRLTVVALHFSLEAFVGIRRKGRARWDRVGRRTVVMRVIAVSGEIALGTVINIVLENVFLLLAASIDAGQGLECGLGDWIHEVSAVFVLERHFVQLRFVLLQTHRHH
jgi:hypothetical protein